MKHFLLLFLLFTATIGGTFAQTDSRDGRHIFNHDIPLTQCNFDGSPVSGAVPQPISANTIFTIRTIVDTDYIIRIARFTAGEKFTEKNIALVATAAGTDIYFKLSVANYNAFAVRLEKKGNFTVGAATTLIKIRPGRKSEEGKYNIYSEFGNDFNIGISAGWKIRPNRLSPATHSLVGGLSFSSIKATPYTTKNYLTAEAIQSCVTFSGGYVFEYDKFQVTLFSGLDVMPGQIGRSWIYKDRPWLGLGFGFQIFRAQGTAGNKTSS
ncbi:hypothetical protein [Hymenobacter algoricola]|uniref:Outer membrane protein beta-barrel domain-containing protein n=1 Tax=Hymenobacter algoricola TaxID=486267 RepID=A0ABP7N3Y6_9BACT